MKKLILIFLLALGLSVRGQAPPHPALCYTITGMPDPSFVALSYHLTGFESGDWVGVYDTTNMLCYGAKPIPEGYPRVQVVGFGDEFLTEKKDGFDYAAVMTPFMYDISANKFYELKGTFINYRDSTVVDKMRFYPLAVYSMVNLGIKREITLAIDPELSKIVCEFVNKTIDIKTGGIDAIKFETKQQNVSTPLFTVALGKGQLITKWDGYYYKPDPTDLSVIINMVASSNFTGQMVTDKLTIQLDQSVSGNTIFEDENMVFYLKGDEVWWKVKSERVSVRLYRVDNGKEKLSWNSTLKPQGTEIRYVSNYSRSWKGQNIRFVAYYYINGKMVNQPTSGSFVL